MKDNRLLKVLWGIVLAIFLCSALFIGISYFTGGDSSSKKKDEETTSTSKSKDKEKDKDKEKNNSKSKTKEKSDEEKYRENKENGNTSSYSNNTRSENNKPANSNTAVNNAQNSNNNTTNNKANTSNKDDKKEVTEANSGATAPGTFSNADAAKAYANEEINRLVKENKKSYSYTLESNNKGEVVVKITQG